MVFMSVYSVGGASALMVWAIMVVRMLCWLLLGVVDLLYVGCFF